MRILFISSGNKGIYEWFESCIKEELSNIHEVEFFLIGKGMIELRSIAEIINPDIVLTLVGFHLPIDVVQWFKNKGIITVVWLTEDPYYIDLTSELVDHYDYVFTIDIAALEFYKNKGHQKSFHLPLATTPYLFKPKQIDDMYQSDICLVGYPYPDRVRYIQLLQHYTPYQIKVVGPWGHLLRKITRSKNVMIYSDWVDPSVVANYYNGAKIVLNTHRPVNQQHNLNSLNVIGKSINNRTFDVAACAAFQLIDFKNDLPFHFIEDEEIVSFKSEEDLLEKTYKFIQGDEARKKIANKGRERVLKEHTFQHRLEKMLSIIYSSSIN